MRSPPTTALRIRLVVLFTAFTGACSSSTTFVTPWSQGADGGSRVSITESITRATSAYQRCAQKEAEKIPSWNPSGNTAAGAALQAVNLCKAREQQLYEVVLEDNRSAPSPQSVAETYVKGVRESLINTVAMSFFQMRR